MNNHKFWFPKQGKSSFGEVCGASLGSLRVSWVVSTRFEGVLGVLWVRLGASECVLEASRGHLGASWGDLGAVLGSLGGFLGLFWKHF